MAEDNENYTIDKKELKSFASALSYDLQIEYYKKSFVYYYQLQLMKSLQKLGIKKDDYTYNRLEDILNETTQKLKATDESNEEETTQKLKATDESNEEETTQKLSNEQFESIKSSLEEFINLQKLRKIGTELELKKSLLEELINLIKLRKLATQYLNNIGIDNLNPLKYKATKYIFIYYDIEELIETYKLNNLKVLKEDLKERAKERAKEEGNKDPEFVHQNALDTETEVKKLIADLPKKKTILSINNDPINIADIHVEDKLQTQTDPETIFNDAILKINSKKEEVYIKNAKFELLTVLQSIKMDDETKYQQIIEQNSSLLNRLFSNYTDEDLQFDTAYSRKKYKKNIDKETIYNNEYYKEIVIKSIYGYEGPIHGINEKVLGDKHTQDKLKRMRNIINDIKRPIWSSFNRTIKKVVGRGGRRSTRKRKKTIRKKRKNKKRTRRFR